MKPCHIGFENPARLKRYGKQNWHYSCHLRAHHLDIQIAGPEPYLLDSIAGPARIYYFLAQPITFRRTHHFGPAHLPISHIIVSRWHGSAVIS
jgi:hypothetical protein